MRPGDPTRDATPIDDSASPDRGTEPPAGEKTVTDPPDDGWVEV